MSIRELKKISKELALQWYPKNGNNYGNRSIESVVDELLKDNRSKTSIIKDIKSFQRNLKK